MEEHNDVTDLMSDLYEELVAVFGKSDPDIRLINKMLRDVIFSASIEH